MFIARRLRWTAHLLPAMTITLLGWLVSCGGPSRPPADTAEIPGYLQLREQVGDFDFAPLRGRSIVIDPGHGGHFRGAVGPDGLTEASVNLGVALYLRGLLEWAGATVWLTRTADYDLLTAADSSLTTDLATRIAIVDSLRPDVFLSIHHNSTASRDPDINETQTYYPIGRDGTDLELARAIHKHLVRNLEISPAKIMPGNFYVLRHSPVPAVLGEPAMISNPVIEGRLSLARSHELEATAYFLGLLEYFAGGVPRLVTAAPDTLHLAAGQPVVWTFAAGAAGAPGLDPQSVQLQVDGVLQPVTIDPNGRTILWYPRGENLAGWHRLELSAGNLASRSAPVSVVTVHGPRAQPWQFDLVYESENHDDRDARRVLIRWVSPQPLTALHRLRLVPTQTTEPLPDLPPPGLRLPEFPGRRGWHLHRAVALPPPDGANSYRLWFDAAISGDSLATTPPQAEPTWRTLAAPWRLANLNCARRWWPDDVVPGGAWRARLLPTAAGASIADLRDPTAPVVAVVPGQPFWFEADGALPIVVDAAHHTPWHEAGTARPDSFAWEPLLPAVIGKVIVLDPTGGGSSVDGTAPLGSRGADLNLQVAVRCAHLLTGLGAEPVLTRRNETWVPPEQKILLANRRGADLFLTIQRSVDPTAPMVVRHHHGSDDGAAWAASTVAAMQPLLAPGTSAISEPSWAYLLRHTACPALQVNLPLPITESAEELANTPAWQEAQARAVVLGIAAQLEGGAQLTESVELAEVIATAGPDILPLERVEWAMLDGNLFWQPLRRTAGSAPDRNGTETVSDTVSYTKTPGLPAAGPRHTLEVHAGPNWQLWALGRNSDGTFSYRLLRENR